MDANGWLWEVGREGETRRVLVEVSGSAWATEPELLPDETAEAIRTEGRSQVERVLDAQDPPRVIQCGTKGCRERSVEDVV